jgi:hypothetical protein
MVMAAKKLREQVVVYLDHADGELLEEVAKKTGLAKTEVFRRGLKQIAGQVLPGRRIGSAFEYLINNAAKDDFPADASERLDDYLYGGRPTKALRRRKKRPKGARLR